MQTHHKTKVSILFSLFFLVTSYIPISAQEMWGMAKYGGAYDKGVIFKMDENAVGQEVVFSFETVQQPEGGLTEYENGIFYGLSIGGGKHHKGVIFKFELDEGKFTKVLDFDGEAKGSGGADRMLLASNGKMYGTTIYGGAHDKGVLFEFDPETESFNKLFDFNGQENGTEPRGSLLEGNDGKLYGTTASGGLNDDGILFSYDISAKEFTKIIDFEAMLSGAFPLGSLIQLSDGIIYGMTHWGGTYDDGLIFSYDPGSSQFNVLFEFDEAVTGGSPVAGLVTAPDGKVYGITPMKPDGIGFLFEYIPQTNTFSGKIEFGTDPVFVGWTCIAARDGNIYWLTDPGLHSPPWVMGYNPQTGDYIMGALASVGSREPAVFMNSLVQGSNDKLYFIANATQIDIRNENTLYEYDAEGDEFTNYYKFSGIETGEFPYGSLYQGADGMLYGTTYIGGANHQGVIFKIDPETYNYTKLIDFENEAKGAKPKGSVVQAGNNKLYGMTSEGGVYDKGVLYELDPVSESFTVLTVFDGINGEHPDGDLVKATNGKLYGVTKTGGTYGEGVLFELDPESGEFNKLIDFQGVQYGSEPVSNALVASSDGYIYGTAFKGGLYNKGVLFEYNPADGNFVKIIEYQETGTGYVPDDLIEANDGKLYTMSGQSEITRIDPDNASYTKSVFDAYIMNPPAGRLLQANNGKFYWMDRGYIWYRAIDFPGAIHEYDFENDTYREVLQFNWSNGSNPENTSLIQLKDFSAPVAQCKNINLYLDAAGEVTLNPSDIDNGSSGEGIELTVSNSSFTCGHTGENEVTLTVTAANGTQDVCNAVVTILDTIAPAVQYKNVELYADASGNAELDPTIVDDGSSDACGIRSMALSKMSFSPEDLGDSEVEFTVTDNNGNTSSVLVTVTVVDTIAPEVVYHDAEIFLDRSGVAELVTDDVDNGSGDAFGIKSMSLSKIMFSCDDAGENVVELTIEDNNGNVSAHPVVVTVTDSVAPEITCINSAEQYLDPYAGDYTVGNTSWDALASDNCMVESLEYTLYGNNNITGLSFEGLSLNAGEHEVEWTAIDNGGNAATCISVITIQKRPTILRITGKQLDREQKVINVEAVLNDSLLLQGIEGKQLVFSCDEESVAAVTNAEGIASASLQVEGEFPETYSIDVRFGEDATYSASLTESEIVTGTASVSVTALKVYPNPFSSKLSIEFTASETADARIDLYDAAGRLVENIFNQPVVAGGFYRTEYIPASAVGNFLMYRMKIGTTLINGKVVKAK